MRITVASARARATGRLSVIPTGNGSAMMAALRSCALGL